MSLENLALFPIWYAIFLFSLTCHEAAHALAAKIGGDLTAYEGGQVSLNPWPHIQRAPFGTVVIPILSFALSGWIMGWASAPYDPLWRMRYPKRAAGMALAGPLANFALVLLAVIGIVIGAQTGFFHKPESGSAIRFTSIITANGEGLPGVLVKFFSILFSLNLLLATFNLLPLPPLDGHTAVGLFISENAARSFYEFTQNPNFALLGILMAWRIFDYVFSPVFRTALRLLYSLL